MSDTAGTSTRRQDLAQAIGAGIAVLCGAWACHSLERATVILPAIWPVNAIIVASLLAAPRRNWPLIALCGLVGNLVGDMASGDAALVSVYSALCNTIQILVCASVFRWLAGAKANLFRPRAFWIFAPLCFAAASTSALIGYVLMGPLVHVDVARTLEVWILADGLGLLIVTPALLAINRQSVLAALTAPRRWRGLAALAGLVVVDCAVFNDPTTGLKFLVSAALIVLVFQMEALGAALGLLITACIAVGMALLGPHAASLPLQDRVTHVLALQAYLAVSAVLNLAVAVTLAGRRQLQESLSASENRYRMITDRATDIILRYDRAGVIEYVSPSILQLGYEPEAMVGRRMIDFVHIEDQPSSYRAHADVMHGRAFAANEHHEFRAVRADGNWVWLQGNPAPVFDGVGKVIGAVSVVRDIAARKVMEDELRRKQAEAEAAARSKADFLANMTHELRTPLTAILGFSGLLKVSDGLNARDARQVELISDASQTLLSVVNDVLDFSRLEDGAVELDSHAFDPREMVEATASLLEGQAAAKGLTLVTAGDGLDGPLLGDGTRLRQVLLNFLSNAIKFTARGEVRVAYRQDDDGDENGGQRRLRVAVTDSGIGVPAQMIDTIFDRFTQADASVSRQYGGTGLGLAICKRIVDAFGGQIGLESRMGEGSTFWFEVSMPIAAAPARGVEEARRSSDVERPLRLLIAEDNAVNRELLSALLGPFDLEIETVTDGVEAVEAAARSAFDIVLMDVQMPNMDGLTATRRIRASETPGARRLPIIAMTANVLPEQRARCLEAGMDDHLGKPINLEKMLEALERWSGEAPEAEAAA